MFFSYGQMDLANKRREKISMKNPIEEIQWLIRGIILLKENPFCFFLLPRHLSNVGFNWFKEAHQPQRWASTSKSNRANQRCLGQINLTRQTLVGETWLHFINPGTKKKLLNLSQLLKCIHANVQTPKPAVTQIKIRGVELNRFYWMNPRLKFVDYVGQTQIYVVL